MQKKIRERLGSFIMAIAGIASVVLGAKAYHDKVQLVEVQKIKLRTEEEAADAINALLDDRNFGYAIVDSEGRVVEWNPAIERITGWTKEEILTQDLKLHDVVPMGDLRDAHMSAFNRAFERQEGRISVVECEIPPHGIQLSSMKIRVTVRVVTTRHGSKYAIAHIDGGDNVIRKHVVTKYPERLLKPKLKKEEPDGTAIRPTFEINATSTTAGSQEDGAGT